MHCFTRRKFIVLEIVSHIPFLNIFSSTSNFHKEREGKKIRETIELCVRTRISFLNTFSLNSNFQEVNSNVQIFVTKRRKN